MKNNQLKIFGWILLFALNLYFIQYEIIRSEFLNFFSAFAALFATYYWGYKNEFLNFNFKQILGFGIFFRAILLFAEPNLSDDYFRFFWDGILSINQINPFQFLPSEIIESYTLSGIDKKLFSKLNSPEYYSVYPPFLQLLFAFAAAIAKSNILLFCIVLKCIILLFEIGSIYLIYKLSKAFNLSEKSVYLYAFNPLIIIELTGNIHFEAVMIFFVLLSIYLLKFRTWFTSAASMSLAFASKLIPLIFLPFLIKRIGFVKSILYGLIVLAGFAILYVPFFDFDLIQNILKSTELYYQSFEFNASIYYIFRWVGYQIIGWNLIAINGKILALATLVNICILALSEKKLSVQSFAKSCLFALFIYFAFANIVHPWYVCTLVALSCLTKYKFAIVWSFVVALSYTTYLTNQYTEILWLVALQYIVVFGFLIWEVFLLKKQKNSMNIIKY